MGNSCATGGSKDLFGASLSFLLQLLQIFSFCEVSKIQTGPYFVYHLYTR
jgi:hypothetical protein